MNEYLIERLKADDFKNELIREYQTNLSVCSRSDGLKIIIEGNQEDVIKTKSLIEIEMKKLENFNSKMEEDDIILIDPYELFDSTNQIRPNRKMEDFGTFKLNEVKSQKEIENKFQNLQVKALTPTEKIQDNLIKLALLKGFKLEEIHKGFKELDNINEIGEAEFINYLKSLRAFNCTSSKVASDSNSDLEIIEVMSSNNSKKSNSKIDFKSINFNKKDHTSSFSSSKASSSLVEYAKMFEAQEFDEENEKTNKTKRISKLIAAMTNDEQKLAAMCEVKNQASRNNSYSLNSEKKPNQKAIPDETIDYISIDCDKNSDSIMIIDDISPINQAIAVKQVLANNNQEQKSSKQFSFEDRNVQPNVYNPALYQDNTVPTNLNSILLHHPIPTVSGTKTTNNHNQNNNNNNNHNNNSKHRISKINKNFTNQRSRSNSARQTSNDKNNNNRNYFNSNFNFNMNEQFNGFSGGDSITAACSSNASFFKATSSSSTNLTSLTSMSQT